MKGPTFNEIQVMCNQGEKVIESELFGNTNYLLKDDNIVILAGKCGQLSVRMENVYDLFDELMDIVDMWARIKTGKCQVQPCPETKRPGRPPKEGRKKAV